MVIDCGNGYAMNNNFVMSDMKYIRGTPSKDGEPLKYR